mgnify:CR=1 FL=1
MGVYIHRIILISNTHNDKNMDIPVDKFMDYGVLGIMIWVLLRYIISKLEQIHRCLEELKRLFNQ